MKTSSRVVGWVLLGCVAMLVIGAATVIIPLVR